VWRLLIALVVAAVSAGGAGAQPDAGSGLFGTVARGSVKPICRPGDPCRGAPAKRVVLVFERAGRVAGRATTGGDGSYRIRLAPGRYTVRVAARVHARQPIPRGVRVPRGRFARVDFHLELQVR
jgi:hypothetical protein